MKKVLIAAVASSLATGAVIATTGIAGSSDTKKTSPPPTMEQAMKDMQKKQDEVLGRVAKRLDISTDKLKAAIDKVEKAKLDEAVDSGKLTDAERDAILACKDDPLKCDRSNLPAFGGPGGPGFRHRGPGGPRLHTERGAKRQDFFEDLAKELDIPAAKVKAAFRAERPKFRRGERGFRTDGPRGFHGPGGGPPPPGGPDGPGGPGAPGSFVAPAGPPGDPA